MINLETFVAMALEDSAWSPDIPFLTRRYEYVPLFVYGTHKLGMADHNDFLAASPLVGYGTTVKNSYKVYFSGDGEPVAIDDPNAGNAVLKGEIYQVPVPALCRLDKAMCNTVHHQRRLCAVEFTTSKNSTSPFTSECWVYEGKMPDLEPFLSRFREAALLTTGRDQPAFLYTALNDTVYRRKHRGS